ncbi:CoA transferase [Nocardioides sp. cx-173]|uniref:CoA transferase n=1 Tax=Nocardioides sp. cx-173 TaxID=2898796 RepID=UPI001E3C789F|nr:CoA transferase [Nocardioides sp. cx-173]MCD4524205.1 CoA transferase [Nocardioides sp. cx-173]UGB41597.1 CoA transferase [Nocardioides sp. cx-173]
MKSASEVRAAAEASVRHSLAVLASHAPDLALPGVEVLDERALLAGSDFVPRRAFRILAAADGWLGLSLARDSDRELVPALVQRPADDADPEACWSVVADWLRGQPVAAAEARAVVLGMPAARIPSGDPAIRRPPVVVTSGGERRLRPRPRVVDLSALWAGPLAARLLGLLGAEVTKVESAARPDGARLGPPAFYERLHAGQESVVLDFGTEIERLHELIGAADVVIEASRPRALRQLGVVAEEHVARGVVWASITAYGREGADGMRVGFGDDVAAGAGLVVRTERGPRAVGDALADPLTGAAAAAAVAVQLARGSGALLDVSMHDVCVAAATESGCAKHRLNTVI